MRGKGLKHIVTRRKNRVSRSVPAKSESTDSENSKVVIKTPGHGNIALLLKTLPSFPEMKMVKNIRAKHHRWFQKKVLFNAGLTSLLIIGLIVGTLLQMTRTNAATTLTWSTNGDFSQNKISKCAPTTTNNIVISGPSYTDATCATSDSDASMSLTKDYYHIKDVASYAVGSDHTVFMKTDGTVWILGIDGSGSYQTYPTQVKGPGGTGFLTGVKSIAASNSYSVAVKNDGTVWVWGNASNGQFGNGVSSNSSGTPVQVLSPSGAGNLTDVKSVSAGNDTAMAVKNDGTLWTWGYGGYGGLGNGTSLESDRPVQVILNGSGVPLTNVATASAGSYQSVAVKNDGTVWAWGLGYYGGLGQGTDSNTYYAAKQVKDSSGTGFLINVTSLTAGYARVVALKNDGTVWAWGDQGGAGSLGTGDNTNSFLPKQVLDTSGSGYLSGIVALSGSLYSAYALTADGSVYAWGSNGNGQLGVGTSNGTLVPVRVKDRTGTGVLTGLSSIVGGNTSVLALDKDGYLLGWGNVGSGSSGTMLGLRPSGYDNTLPNYVIGKINLTPLSGISQISSSQSNDIFLKSDGTVLSMGYIPGNGTTDNSNSAVQVQNSDGSGYLSGITQVASGASHSMVLKNDGTVWAWGRNYTGQLGTGDTTDQTRPTQVKNSDGSGFLTDITYISANAGASYAVKSDGTLYGWGDSSLIRNGVSNRSLPFQIKNSDGSGYLTDVKSVSTGNGFSAAVKNDGTVWAWGNNSSGQLGDNTTTSATYPVQVKSSDGSSYLTDVKSISVGIDFALALKNDGTLWGWGNNYVGELGDGTSTSRPLPVQVIGSTGSGYLTNVVSMSANIQSSFAVKSDGTIYGWGYNGNQQLGVGYGPGQYVYHPTNLLGLSGTGTLTGSASVVSSQYAGISLNTDGTVYGWGIGYAATLGYDLTGNTGDTYFPRVMYADVQLKAGYSSTGSASGYVVDAGVNHKYQWNTINWNSTALPSDTKISFSVRTSNDGTTWTAWTTDQEQSVPGTTTGTATMTGLAISRYVEVRPTLSSPDQDTTPTLNDFSLTYINDTTAPTTNATNIQMKKSSSATSTIADSAWTNAVVPYFSWTAGADNGGGIGLLGYCLYLGQDASADLTQTKGILGTSPVSTDGTNCQYIVSGNSLDTSVNTLSATMTTSSTPYHLLVKAIDKAGNLYASDAEPFSFKFDNTPPTPPAFISSPSQFIATKDATLTWPTTGAQAAADADSGLAGLQYKVGTNGTWYGDDHTGAQDITDILANDGSYQTNATYDYPLINEGNNILYFRVIDNAGNVSTTNDTAVIKINTTSPTPPQNLTATPTTSTANAFSFTWSAPSSFVGPANAVTYCYTVNTLPTENTCTYTPAGTTTLATDAYATQPGSNIMYVVAKDEAGNVNYDTYAQLSFTANTPAPGIPVGTEIADISTKATQVWKLALSWATPDDVGAGISKYAVYRSTNGVTFSQVATTSGLSYVDSNLTQDPYYYKIRACDSANNCGAFSDVFSKTPTGRFTSPPELVQSPSVQVSTKTATFTYVTDRVSDSRIQYGTASGVYFPAEVAVSTLTKNHKVEMSNLDAGTTYYYKAKWTDEDGNTGTSTELSFTTLPAPTIQSVSVLKTALNSATIRFTSTDASSVNIYYGKTDSFGGVVSINTSRSQSTYSVELPGLDDGSTYFYKFGTFDADNNEYDSHRADDFTTPERPRISNLRFQPVPGEPTSTQKVIWTTNVPTDSTVTYGKLGQSTRDIYDATLTTNHESKISNLDDASQYTLLAQSRDTSGNLATSDLQSFQTALDTRPPGISDIQVESTVKGNGSEARGQVVLSWKTDEPATSQVAYSQGTHGMSYTSQTAEDTRLSYDHVVIISDLAVSSIYHLQPISRDKSNNTARGADTSAIVGRATDSVLNVIISTVNKIFGF